MKSTFFISSVAVVLGSFLLPSATTAIVVDPCTLSLGGLLSDSGLNSCLPLQQLSQFLTTNVTSALVNSTLATFCPMPVCPAASITLVENTVTQNCVNSSDPTTSELVYGAATLYSPAKQGLCQTVSATNGTFCATVLTESMITYLAQHPSPLGLGIFGNATVLQQYVNAMPQDLLCTPCNKAMINPLTNFIAKNQTTLSAPVLKWANVIEAGVQAKCGADFTNGAAPTSSSPSTTGGSGAKSSAISVHGSYLPSAVMVLLISTLALVL
ncbi:hypothetical protein BGZ49_002503 [Haplosporangium sp. Z 27]|nr:hypothetical protein BGZ49_002503 [Haplosporangium sp. Z 27]